MTKHSLLPTPTQMIAHLDRFVRGQVRAKQDIAVAVYNHYMSQAFRDRTGTDLGRHHKEQLSDDEKESLRLTTFLLLNPFYSYFYLIKGGYVQEDMIRLFNASLKQPVRNEQVLEQIRSEVFVEGFYDYCVNAEKQK